MDRAFKTSNSGLEFCVYLTPGSQKEAITDILIEGDLASLKIAVHARPTDNQANEGLIKFLSGYFKIAKSKIIIKRGQKSRNKQIFINEFCVADIPADVLEHIKSLLSKSNTQLTIF